ncbi:MAG: hypothetical protein KZY76_01625 [Bacillus sp. (in: Bacteria)]|uniref:YqgO n=1 Tax=Bacillus paralicheniformis TaxID=1648923 RepID=A0A7Z0WY43_9BACI|nr:MULTISPECIES: hypothetical protein [Bacillus]MBL7474442.1 hypothetical protein [Bacillus paralicheniformis]MBW4884347.1 hypothetical protein [Bacillus sp. (in: firmicutes)]MBX9435528.1 hypothetical protein [Bacillus paralicheniformis]MCM3421911.1 hypothetical protein [Bacillus paralicheniformis]MCW4367604.1 hypothetical protein [Bacillus paralicheniformis]
MRKVTFIAVGIIAALVFFQNRYRVINFILGQNQIRHYFIHLMMRIPFFRNKFIQQAF